MCYCIISIYLFHENLYSHNLFYGTYLQYVSKMDCTTNIVVMCLLYTLITSILVIGVDLIIRQPFQSIIVNQTSKLFKKREN